MRVHHIANGTATTDLIVEAGIPGSWSIWADPLHDGPVPSALPDATLVDIRSTYLARGTATAVAVANDLQAWRNAVDNSDAYEEIVLWFEHDLFDQLNLIQLLCWIRANVPRSKIVSLVCIGSFPGRVAFKGLGELTAAELASLLPLRSVVRDDQYAVADRAWRALGRSSPLELDALRHADISSLPFLAAALARLLQEFPWTRGGVTRSERRLLELVDAGPVAPRTALPLMHVGEDAYYITDLSFGALVQELSSLAMPLLRSSTASRDHDSTKGTIAITDFGRSVLNGREDRIHACGIDRWLGGVHVTPTNDWRWNPTEDRVEKVR